MKKLLLSLFLLGTLTPSVAENVKVEKFRYAGPFPMRKPVMVDSVKPDKSKFKEDDLLSASVNMKLVEKSDVFTDSILPEGDKQYPSISLLQFGFNNSSYAKVKINIGKLKNYKLFVDGKSQSAGSEIALVPAGHTVTIKYLSKPEERDTAIVTISPVSSKTKEGTPATISLAPTDGKPWKIYTPEVGTKSRVTSTIRPSADGLYYIQADYQRTPDNKTNWMYMIKDVKTNSVRLTSSAPISWTREGHVFSKYVNEGGKRKYVLVDAQTLGETVLFPNVPREHFDMLPNMKQAIVSNSVEGEKPNEDMHIYYHPEDRVPGWRSRTNLSLYDFETGVSQPLTYGFRNTYLCDISLDSKKILFATSTECIEKMRPTSETTLCIMDLQTMEVDTIIPADGFFASASFSPDGKQLVIKGSPEFANRIGCTLPEGKIPNMYDYQLYVMDIATKEITPLTRDFNPSIEDFEWSEFDNKIYFTALDKDRCNLYQLDFLNDSKKSKKSSKSSDSKNATDSNNRSFEITKVEIPQDYVGKFELSINSPLIGVKGQGMTDLGETFFVNAKTLKVTKVEDIHDRELAEYIMPTLHDFNFTNSNGDEITGCYLMPPAEVIEKLTPREGETEVKLPLIVYYYGGCSPTSRFFSMSYAFQALASQGYVVYFVEPRGAAGFSQEFGAWHVNTAGDPQTQDIIEGTNKLCEALPIIDRTKMGCMGASYGGFMTQYLQTKTDMFACAISHAGISNHASYWGFGYWGYTYSQVSMAGKYPWTDKKLYVENSPLFNVDKIKTPLLFLHGTDDRNVPPIESSQMFTALRLLGKETAYVTFQGEGHHIQQYNRLLNWQNTIQAWFEKYLKGNDTWWNSLYKETSLY